MTYTTLVVSPLAGALALVLCAPAIAAPAPDPLQPTDLDVVEVHAPRVEGYAAKRTGTATRTDTLLRDIPQSITVVTQEQIRDQGLTSLTDAMRYVPGVGIAQGEGNRDTPVLRGNSSTADLFVDGMRDDVQYIRDLYNIESVEALKGPNAMIFGRGGAGGVINRVTKVADWRDHHEMSLQVGDYNRSRGTLDVGQALNPNSAFRVTAMYEDSASHRDGFVLQRYGINPTFSLRVGDRTQVTLGYEHFRDDRIADRGIPSSPIVFNGRKLPIETDPSTFFGNAQLSPIWARVNAFNALVDHDFGNGVTLRNRTRWAGYDKFYQNVFPGTVNAAGTQVAISAYNNVTQRENVFNQTDVMFAVDTGSIRHKLLAGAEFGRQETDNFRTTGFFGAPGATATSANVLLANPRYNGPLSFRQNATDADNHSVARIAAVYVQDQIEFSPHWQAIVGVRYDRIDVDFENKRRPVGHAERKLSSTDNLLSPRAGLVYKPAEQVSIYGSYGLTYLPRAGEQLSSLSPSNKALDPERFSNYELGAKWDLRPDLALTAAVYRLDRSNVLTTDPANPTLSILVDGQRTEGVEIGLNGRVTEAWSVIGGYAWQDGRITGEIRTSPTSAIPKGTVLAQLPEQTASLWNRYDFSPTWGVGLGAIYRDEILTSLATTANPIAVTLKGYTRYDAAVFFSLNEHVKLQLNVENLFDKQYFASAHSDNNITPGSPRALYLSANFSF